MRTSALRFLALLMLPGIASAVSFTPLGYLDGDSISSAYAVSTDGSVVVGRSTDSLALNAGQAFRWTSVGGMVGLGSPSLAAYGVSADGSVVVGSHSFSAPLIGAFRWTGSTGVTALIPVGELSGGGRGSDDVSADGSVVVGGLGYYAAFRWTIDDGWSDLGQIWGEEQARGVSADGNVVAGSSGVPVGVIEAYRWTSGTGMVGLGDLGWASATGYRRDSTGWDISADGAAIVGGARNAAGTYQAYRWTSGTGMVGLGVLDGDDFSEARSASGDGSVIVGHGGSGAFVWTAPGGMQGLSELLVAGGVDLTGWTLSTAEGVSDDGQWVVGEGINPLGQREAYLANIPQVPIPPTVWLLSTGLAGLGGRRLLRRKISS